VNNSVRAYWRRQGPRGTRHVSEDLLRETRFPGCAHSVGRPLDRIDQLVIGGNGEGNDPSLEQFAELRILQWPVEEIRSQRKYDPRIGPLVVGEVDQGGEQAVPRQFVMGESE
jgi:hypothetical protein